MRSGKMTKKKRKKHQICAMKVVLVSFGPEAVACVCDLFQEKGSW